MVCCRRWLASLSSLVRAPLTLILFSLANLVLLRQRIQLEEVALREVTCDEARCGR
jgi:isoprenylcysteine carboxyl methyltransferase (ICMT) family protein YpbQ